MLTLPLSIFLLNTFLKRDFSPQNDWWVLLLVWGPLVLLSYFIIRWVIGASIEKYNPEELDAEMRRLLEKAFKDDLDGTLRMPLNGDGTFLGEEAAKRANQVLRRGM